MWLHKRRQRPQILKIVAELSPLTVPLHTKKQTHSVQSNSVEKERNSDRKRKKNERKQERKRKRDEEGKEKGDVTVD